MVNEETTKQDKAPEKSSAEPKKAVEPKEEKQEEKKEEGTKDQAQAQTQPKVFKNKNKRRRIVRGQAHIKCSYNNTLVTLTDLHGGVLGWASAGSMGFKGAKKATPYAATVVAGRALENVSKNGLKEVEVFVRGVGAGREAAIRALGNNGLKVNSIKDVTPVPHNGCRSKKARRV